MIPEPDDEAARRIARIEARCFPRVMVWDPDTSVSGHWEAMGHGWLIEEEDPARFYDQVRWRVGEDVEAAKAAAAPEAALREAAATIGEMPGDLIERSLARVQEARAGRLAGQAPAVAPLPGATAGQDGN